MLGEYRAGARRCQTLGARRPKRELPGAGAPGSEAAVLAVWTRLVPVVPHGQACEETILGIATVLEILRFRDAGLKDPSH